MEKGTIKRIQIQPLMARFSIMYSEKFSKINYEVV